MKNLMEGLKTGRERGGRYLLKKCPKVGCTLRRGVVGISIGGDDRMELKVKTQKNP